MGTISRARRLPRAIRPLVYRGALALALLLAPSSAGAPEGGRLPPPEESFVYNIRFLWFERAAVGTLRLSQIRGSGRYRAELQAQTRGLIGFFLPQKNAYESLLRWSPAHGRLIPQQFRKRVTVGEDDWTSDTELDYASHVMVWSSHKNGRVVDRGREPIPAGTIYEDILSAFFNLRNGAYGPIEKGRFIRLQTLPIRQRDTRGEEVVGSEFVRTFEIQIADRSLESRYRKLFGREGERGYLVLVKVPKEIFGQETGEVRIWLDQNLVPLEATVEDAILYGDVTGILRGYAKPAPPLEVEPEGVSD